MPLRRHTGVVTKFNHERGFGFVRVDGPGHSAALIHLEVFVPHVGRHEIGCGVRVEFELEDHAKGLRCARATII